MTYVISYKHIRKAPAKHQQTSLSAYKLRKKATQNCVCKQASLKSKTFSIIVYILNSTKLLRVNLMSETVEDRVKKALEQVRPQLQADGGDIEYVGFDNGIVKVKMKGACNGCPMSTMTLQWGVENFLKKRIPEVTKVQAVQ
jgi:Fe-S cluster biogenesis protein NfuA